MLTFNCIKSFISTRETRENDRVCVVLLFLFRKEARKKYHVVVVFVVSSSQNDVRSLSFFFLCLSRNARSVSTVFKAHYVLGRVSVRLSLLNFRFRSANRREALYSKSRNAHMFFTFSLFLKRRSLFSFSSHAVSSSCPCG